MTLKCPRASTYSASPPASTYVNVVAADILSQSPGSSFGLRGTVLTAHVACHKQTLAEGRLRWQTT